MLQLYLPVDPKHDSNVDRHFVSAVPIHLCLIGEQITNWGSSKKTAEHLALNRLSPGGLFAQLSCTLRPPKFERNLKLGTQLAQTFPAEQIMTRNISTAVLIVLLSMVPTAGCAYEHAPEDSASDRQVVGQNKPTRTEHFEVVMSFPNELSQSAGGDSDQRRWYLLTDFPRWKDGQGLAFYTQTDLNTWTIVKSACQSQRLSEFRVRWTCTADVPNDEFQLQIVPWRKYKHQFDSKYSDCEITQLVQMPRPQAGNAGTVKWFIQMPELPDAFSCHPTDKRPPGR